jgi:hypothetical protein
LAISGRIDAGDHRQSRPRRLADFKNLLAESSNQLADSEIRQ